jgi:hypothetical protein
MVFMGLLFFADGFRDKTGNVGRGDVWVGGYFRYGSSVVLE